jgi:hypothetical protein
MALSDEEKAARKVARQAANARNREKKRQAEDESRRAEAAARFDGRTTRRSAAKSIEKQALTREEYIAAEERGLVGGVPTPQQKNRLDAATASRALGVDVNTTGRWSISTSSDNVTPYSPEVPEIVDRPVERSKGEVISSSPVQVGDLVVDDDAHDDDVELDARSIRPVVDESLVRDEVVGSDDPFGPWVDDEYGDASWDLGDPDDDRPEWQRLIDGD